MHKNIMRTNLILINFKLLVCVELMNTEYQQDKFFWRLVDVMLWISGGFVSLMKWEMISQLSHQVAWIQEWYFSWRLKKLDIIFGIPNFQGEKLSPSVPTHIRELQDKLIYRLSGDNELMIDYSQKRHSPIHSLNKYC